MNARESKVEQEIRLTFGGWVDGKAQDEKLDGVCVPESTRSILECDIYNGLPNWTITEVIVRVAWSPYIDENVRSFKVITNIKPMTTEHAKIRLGLQLPRDTYQGRLTRDPNLQWQKHWGWLIVGAKGFQTK